MTKNDAITFHHYCFRPHAAKPARNYLEYSPHIPDLSFPLPSDYQLFWPMQKVLTGNGAHQNAIKNWFDSFLAAKPPLFFWDGVHKLPERWDTLSNIVVLVFLK